MNDKTDESVEKQEEVEAQAPAEEVIEAEVEAPELESPTRDELMQQLQDAEAKAEASRDQALRIQAELENTRRRAKLDVEGAHKFALEKFVNELLPVKDSLEMGEAASRAEGADLDKVREGIELTLKMMGDVMGKFGVVEVNPVGEKFNPDLHQAMSMQDVADAEPNTVINVFQKGYVLNERLVRPAMVVVAGVNSGGKPTENSVDEMA